VRSLLFRLAIFAVVLAAAYLSVLGLLAHGGARAQRWARSFRIPVRVAEARGDTRLRFSEIERYHDVDLLFAGSSHCYRSFDPRFFAAHGLTSFNAGSTAQTPLNSYFILRRHLDTLRPRVLVYEAYWGVLATDGVESLIDLCSATDWGSDLVRMALASRSASAVTGYILDRFDPRPRSAGTLGPGDRYIPGGFVEKDSTWIAEQRFPDRGPVEMREQQLTYLRRVLRMASRRGIATVLVVQPVPAEHLDRITNREAILARLRSLAQDEGACFLDLNGSVRLDDRGDFFDADHLNQRGVVRVNARILEELKEWGLLDDEPPGVPPL